MTKEVNCMNCMVGRFKDDLCDEKMCEALKGIGNSDDFVHIIMLAKEIVQCKDCKYLYRKEAYGDEWKECTHYPQHYTKLNDFCSHGERKEL